MSSAIVYGNSGKIGQMKRITKETPVSPANCYGDSKVQAEKGLLALGDQNFKIVILRPPMIYGKDCKGNYQMLRKIALKIPFFPYIKNERSMLYIDNLCEFVKLMIDNDESGIFWPQNDEYSNTSELVKQIALANNKKVVLIPYCTWILKIASRCTGLVNKAFGNLAYEKDISEYKEKYQVYSLVDSINKIEK